MLKTKEEIKDWLDEMEIKNYNINEDLTVDVDGNVDISYEKLKEIPVQFGVVNGDFNCKYNELKNLKGCPEVVNGDFDCSSDIFEFTIKFENKLTSLTGCPKVIHGDFNCSYNELTSLEDCPESIGGSFDCGGNKIKNLKGCPEIINGDFCCNDNKLTSLENFPKVINGGNIQLNRNDIKEEELLNFNCKLEKIEEIYSDFNIYGDAVDFLNKVNSYKDIKKENEELLKLTNNSNAKTGNKKKL